MPNADFGLFIYTPLPFQLEIGQRTMFSTWIDRDTDFLCTAGAYQFVEEEVDTLRVRIGDGTNGRFLCNDYIPLSLLFGDAESGARPWLVPYCFKAGSTIRVDFLNDPDIEVWLRLFFIGKKVLPDLSSGRTW